MVYSIKVTPKSRAHVLEMINLMVEDRLMKLGRRYIINKVLEWLGGIVFIEGVLVDHSGIVGRRLESKGIQW